MRVFIVMGVVVLAACGSTQLASRYVKSVPVKSGEATVIQVSSADAPSLAGVQLDVPSGALVGDTTLTLDVAPSLVAESASAGVTVEWGPAGTRFAKPVKLTLPYALPAGASASRLNVFVRESDGAELRVRPAAITRDEARGLLSFTIDGFTRFQPTTLAECASDGDCSGGLVCRDGFCSDPEVCVAVLESCNGRDDDCDGAIDEDTTCPAIDAGVCVAVLESCNGRDDDCDGAIDEDTTCPAVDAGVCVAVIEWCNVRDDDCDGQVDEGGVCDPACSAAADCGPGESCAGGVCVVGTPRFCGGIANIQCGNGIACLDDRTDTCVPDVPGRGTDCGGWCER